MKVRTLPETNSSSSHALVFPPHLRDNTLVGIETINYAVQFIKEMFDKKTAEKFKKEILSDKDILEELKSHPEFELHDTYYDIDSYTIPEIVNYTDLDETELIIKLYKKVLKETIKHGWGVEMEWERNPYQPNVPWYSPIFSEGRIYIYRTGNYTTYILESTANTKNTYSKIKILDDGETEYIATTPESIDLKITNKCHAMCPFCHENSTPDGEHATSDAIKKLADALKETPVPEIAIGGGNPLLHPEIEDTIRKLSITSRVAITARDIDYIEYGIPHGATAYGVSLTTPINLAKLFNIIEFPNYPVIHVINGVHRTEDVSKAIRVYIEKGPQHFVPAVLILGFKHFGRGKNWRMRNTIDIDALMKKYPNVIYAFDDLAIKQLNIRPKLTPREWELLYNGEDGKYTMYIDLVKMEYAKNSYSEERYPIKDWDIEKMFSRAKNPRR